MANRYIVREESGIMVAMLGKHMFNQLLQDLEGHWGTDKSGNHRFYVEDDCCYTARSGDNALTVYFWEGYSIAEENQ